MAHPSRRSRGFARARRPAKTWNIGPGGDDIPTLDVLTFSSSTTMILGAGITPTVDPLTILRTRGFLNFNLRAASAQGDGYNWAAGIGIVSADAFAVGVTATPNPFDDASWSGWLWHAMGGFHTSIGALAIGDPSVNQVSVEIDSKAMRKLKLNEIAFLAIQAGETGTSVMHVAGATRMLLQESAA